MKRFSLIAIAATASLLNGCAPPPAQPVGKFQLMSRPRGSSPGDLYRIDTMSGQTWELNPQNVWIQVPQPKE